MTETEAIQELEKNLLKLYQLVEELQDNQIAVWEILNRKNLI